MRPNKQRRRRPSHSRVNKGRLPTPLSERLSTTGRWDLPRNHLPATRTERREYTQLKRSGTYMSPYPVKSQQRPAERNLVEFDDVVGQTAQIPAKMRQRIRIHTLGTSLDHFRKRLKGMGGHMRFALRQERLDGETPKMNHPRHLVDQEEGSPRHEGPTASPEHDTR